MCYPPLVVLHVLDLRQYVPDEDGADDDLVQLMELGDQVPVPDVLVELVDELIAAGSLLISLSGVF